jgi:hypothetical protein
MHSNVSKASVSLVRLKARIAKFLLNCRMGSFLFVISEPFEEKEIEDMFDARIRRHLMKRSLRCLELSQTG